MKGVTSVAILLGLLLCRLVDRYVSRYGRGMHFEGTSFLRARNVDGVSQVE